MINEAWSEMDQTYMKNSSEKHFLDKNYGPQLLKLWTAILGLAHWLRIADRNYWGWKRELAF
jgi:hypothetical protein